jgi:hypothetical protein
MFDSGFQRLPYKIGEDGILCKLTALKGLRSNQGEAGVVFFKRVRRAQQGGNPRRKPGPSGRRRVAERAMANLDIDDVSLDLQSAKRLARRSAHVQRAQVMLLAACGATLGVVAVAGAMLTSMF